MSWKIVRNVFLAGAGLVVLVPATQSGDCGPPAPCGPMYITKKVLCTEYRPQPYEATRTVYTTAYREEKYTHYTCEVVPQTLTRPVTYCRTVPTTEQRQVTRYECVPTTEQRHSTGDGLPRKQHANCRRGV